MKLTSLPKGKKVSKEFWIPQWRNCNLSEIMEFRKTMKIFIGAVFVCCLSISSHALDNGLALTPPMGWLSWERFTCNIDCKNDPNNCISENLYKQMGDIMVAEGYKDVGYTYVNVDDCWMELQRDSKNKLQANSERFPNGIKGLANHMHSKGLKLGIYTDCGTKTCAGYPGSSGYYDTDADTFAEWGIDMLKVDGCYADPKQMDNLYPQITEALNNSGRPIVFSCSWPAYQVDEGMSPNYADIAENCNLWRNYNDIEDSWESVLSIVDFYKKNQDALVAAAGPGHWNDPDMILAGNFGLTYGQAKAQFALWAIMASPLLMSNDLREMDPKMKEILLNKNVIAVNQDRLGIMGKCVYDKGNVEIWTRPIEPVSKSNMHSYALVFFNRRTLGGAVQITTNLQSIGLVNPNCYTVSDVFQFSLKEKFCPSDNYTVLVDPSSVHMIVAQAL